MTEAKNPNLLAEEMSARRDCQTLYGVETDNAGFILRVVDPRTDRLEVRDRRLVLLDILLVACDATLVAIDLTLVHTPR